jgi:hypothetical protein
MDCQEAVLKPGTFCRAVVAADPLSPSTTRALLAFSPSPFFAISSKARSLDSIPAGSSGGPVLPLRPVVISDPPHHQVILAGTNCNLQRHELQRLSFSGPEIEWAAVPLGSIPAQTNEAIWRISSKRKVEIGIKTCANE